MKVAIEKKVGHEVAHNQLMQVVPSGAAEEWSKLLKSGRGIQMPKIPMKSR